MTEPSLPLAAERPMQVQRYWVGNCSDGIYSSSTQHSFRRIAGVSYNKCCGICAEVEEQLAAEVEDHQCPVTRRVFQKKIVECATDNEEETSEDGKEKTLCLDRPVSMDHVNHQSTANKGAQGHNDRGVPGIAPELVKNLACVFWIWNVPELLDNVWRTHTQAIFCHLSVSIFSLFEASADVEVHTE